MASTTIQFNLNPFGGLGRLRRRLTARGLWFGLILLAALVAFELFNFATTEFALQTLFGERDALGVATWASVLAVAFCGIDFAGLSRLFTPETGRKEPKEVWLLTGAWFLGASMNAIMTWWAVGSALSANPALGNDLLTRQDILLYGPIFIAALVWLTRILIIGTFAFAGDHLFSTADRYSSVVDGMARPVSRSQPRTSGGIGNWFKRNIPRSLPHRAPRAVPKPAAAPALTSRNEPLASSSYARAADAPAERRVYESQRSFFGRGAGDDERDSDSRYGSSSSSRATPTPAYASATREAYTPPTQRSLPAAKQSSPPAAAAQPSYTATWGTPRAERQASPRAESLSRPEPAPTRVEPPARAEPAPRPESSSRPESSPRPEPVPMATPAYSAPSSPASSPASGGRASSVRTVGSVFSRDRRLTTTTTVADDYAARDGHNDRRAEAAAPTSSELEYIDLD